MRQYDESDISNLFETEVAPVANPSAEDTAKAQAGTPGQTDKNVQQDIATTKATIRKRLNDVIGKIVEHEGFDAKAFSAKMNKPEFQEAIASHIAKVATLSTGTGKMSASKEVKAGQEINKEKKVAPTGGMANAGNEGAINKEVKTPAPAPVNK